MIRRNKTYRALISGYWMMDEQNGHWSAIMNLPYDRINATRKTRLENKIRNMKGVDHVAITGFQVNR
ncbi:hypothetical protein [Paenibacillus sp. P32E]|uniref:hypothetical protein n=1 Tax=Paenibacillus sp. P32E TaxID=1349434 RepID=UPI00093F1D3E|nr:hypothetical protein [Paenibacillus sp. P32E]OKP91385.1 hypothetical protein A3848_09780 [Paenibacillus sp. P32E]